MNLRLALLPMALLLPVAACGGGGGGGPSGPTFSVTSSTPANGAQNVPQDSHVVVHFSMAIDPATYNQGSIQVGLPGVGAEPGTLSMPAADTIEYTPSGVLEGGSATSVLISQYLKSTSGLSLSGTTAITFLTAGVPGTGVILPLATALQPTAGRMDTGRRNHTATLLNDGRVLICGGFIGGTTVTDRAETFDPLTQRFTRLTSPMRKHRASHTATILLDGRVLIAGGQYEAGAGTLNADLSSEIFDPAFNTFSDAGNMTSQRFDHAARRLPDGRILVTGGSKYQGSSFLDLSSAEVFTPGTGLWTAWPSSLVHTHATHAMLDLEDGRWLVTQGSDVDLRAEIFTVVTGTFTTVSAPATDSARFGAAAETFADGDAAVAGGGTLASVLHFKRSSTQVIDSGGSLSAPRAYATATRIADDRVLVVGGIDYTRGSLILLSCDLVVQGGVAGSRTYSTAVTFPNGIANHTATVLQDGRILYCGGLQPTFGLPELDGGYLFTP